MPVKVGGDSRVSSAGFHGNSVSGNHPPGTATVTKSVEIFTNPILIKSTNEGGEEGEKAEQINGSSHETNCTTSHGWNT